MSDSNVNPPLPPPPTYGTSLVDRMNIFIHFRKYIRLAIKRWFILSFCLFCCAGAAVYIAKTSPDIYEAFSQMQGALHIEVQGDNDGAVYDTRFEPDWQTDQLANLNSPDLHLRIREILSSRPEFTGVLTNGFFEGYFWTASKGQGSAVRMAVRSKNLEYCKAYADEWVNQFQAFNEGLKSSSRDDRLAQKQEERRLYQNTLLVTKSNELATLQRVPELRNDLGVSEYTLLTNRVFSLGIERDQFARELSLLNASTAEDILLRSGPTAAADIAIPESAQSATFLSEVQGSGEFARLTQSLREKELLLQQYRSQNGLKDMHPKVRQLAREISQLEGVRTIVLNQAAEDRTRRLTVLNEQISNRNLLISQEREKLEELAAASAVLQSIREEKTKLEADIERLDVDISDLEVASTSEDMFRVSVRGRASSMGPVAPNRAKIIAMGLIGGLALGIGIIFLLQKLDDRLELAEDIEAELEEPVLGQIPLVDKKLAGKDHILISDLGPHNMFCEAIRGVRSAVKFGGTGNSHQVLVVTSATPGDGKSTFTVNFAATLASAGQKTLLIDADLRRGTSCYYFDQPRDPGLTEVLTGELHWMDVVNETSFQNMDVIHTGRLAVNPGELLLSPILEELIAQVREHYEYVIFDCPPLTAIDDAFSIMKLADGTLFVVRAGRTTMRFAKSSLLEAQKRGVDIMGIILNGITTSDPGYYYAKYYHAYYNKDLPSSREHDVTSSPATKMAAPKTVRFRPASIDEAAKAHAAGRPVTSDSMPKQKKSINFKTRRAVRKGSAGGG